MFEIQQTSTVSWKVHCGGSPEGPLAVVEGLTVGRFAVVVLLADVGLLTLAQRAQLWRQGGGSRNAAGTEKVADICSRGTKTGEGTRRDFRTPQLI